MSRIKEIRDFIKEIEREGHLSFKIENLRWLLTMFEKGSALADCCEITKLQKLLDELDGQNDLALMLYNIIDFKRAFTNALRA